MVAGAEGSSGAEWLHEHHRRYGDVYVNQGEEYALRLLELEANFLSIFLIFLFLFDFINKIKYSKCTVYPCTCTRLFILKFEF